MQATSPRLEAFNCIVVRGPVEECMEQLSRVPDISVVIAWVNSFELIGPSLESLERQHGKCPVEIIIATRHEEHAQRRLQRAFPGVTLLPAAPNTPITALRSMGIKHAHGSVIVVTEDHCVPCSNWITTVDHWMTRGCEVVGGPVENAYTKRSRDWAAFLAEYAGAIRPSIAEIVTVDQLPGNNVAYRRELIDGLCATLDRGLWESFYHHELAQRGVRMIFDPEMLVYHNRPFDFWYFVGQRYHFCRSFAGMRCQSFSTFDRLKYGLGSLLLPPFLLLRGWRTLLQKRRLIGRYLLCLPLIGIYVTIGAFGEATGYFLGGGNSLEKVE